MTNAELESQSLSPVVRCFIEELLDEADLAAASHNSDSSEFPNLPTSTVLISQKGMLNEQQARS